MKRSIVSVILLCLLSSPAYGQARFEADNMLASGGNPFALADFVNLSWTWRLNKSEHPLLSGAHFAFGVSGQFSPAFGSLGAWLEFSPLSLLDLRFGAAPIFYPGILGYALGFPDYDALYSEAEINRRDDLDESRPLLGGYAYFSPTLKMKVGNVIAYSTAKLEFWKTQNPENLVGGTFFYDPFRITLIDGNGDTLFMLDSALLYMFKREGKRPMFFGLNHELLSLPNGGNPDNQNQRQTLGFLGRIPIGEKFASFHQPELLAKAYLFVQERADLGRLNEPGFRIALRFTFSKPLPPPGQPAKPAETEEAEETTSPDATESEITESEITEPEPTPQPE